MIGVHKKIGGTKEESCKMVRICYRHQIRFPELYPAWFPSLSRTLAPGALGVVHRNCLSIRAPLVRPWLNTRQNHNRCTRELHHHQSLDASSDVSDNPFRRVFFPHKKKGHPSRRVIICRRERR